MVSRASADARWKEEAEQIASGGLRIWQGDSGMWFAARETGVPLFVTASSEDNLRLAVKQVEEAMIHGR